MATRDDPDSVTTGQASNNAVRTGKRFKYGQWLQPIVTANDSASSNRHDAANMEAVATPRRGRGRPRVARPRDESAIEKRRAQVREAQRTYQKRKDTAAVSEQKRFDDVLQVMFDLSTDIEALLQTASKSGLVNQQGELQDRLRALWGSYDTAINSPCWKSELKPLQTKNERRRADYQSNDNPSVDPAPSAQPDSHGGTTHENQTAEPSLSHVDLDLMRVQGSTLIQNFSAIQGLDPLGPNPSTGGRTIFEVLKERRAEFLRNNPN